MEKEIIQTASGIISSKELLDHWQGHRRLSRKVIEAFPEDKLFSHSIGGMRTFADLAKEMIEMAAMGIHGMVTGEWIQFKEMKQFASKEKPKTKAEILAIWDEITALIDQEWPKIKDTRFQEVDNAYGQYEGTIISFLFYFIDNEVHHRGQGYVYLRSLGITPPFFWERD
jgi:uncharacterized damage-inducible protein DinB